jgi:hypothetical protein
LAPGSALADGQPSRQTLITAAAQGRLGAAAEVPLVDDEAATPEPAAEL